MKTKDEFIKEVSHHAFIEIIEIGALDYVEQAMDNFAQSQNKELIEALKMSNQIIEGEIIAWNAFPRKGEIEIDYKKMLDEAFRINNLILKTNKK